MSAPSTTASEPPERAWGIWKWIAIGVSGIVVLVVVGWLLTVTLGQHSGEEFSPQTFQRRQFSYLELPWIGIQVRPVEQVNSTGPVERILTKGSYVTATRKNVRWDLVTDNRGRGTEPHYDARILIAYLDMMDDNGGYVWRQWTADHPTLAAVLWPQVANVARSGMYIFIPELMQIARSESDLGGRGNPQRLAAGIDGALATSYGRTADAERALGRHDRAIQLYTRAIERDGGRAALYRGRAKSYAASGEEAKAAADLAKATEIDQAASAADE